MPPSLLRLGVSPLSWVNEVLEDFGRGTEAETILTEAARAGFAGVEMSRAFPSAAPALRAMLAPHGMQMISGWHSGFLTERSVEAELVAVADHANLLAECGASVMVYGECGHMAPEALDVPMHARWILSAPEMAAYGACLTRFAEALHARYGLRLAYHHHLMMVAERQEEIIALMAASGPAVGLLLDTGHAQAAGFAPARLIEDFGNRINHIHLKDVRADVLARVQAQNLSFNAGVRAGMFTVPGDGCVDFAPLAAFLAQGSYDGWLVVEAEQNPALAPPAETVTRAERFVRTTIMPTSY